MTTPCACTGEPWMRHAPAPECPHCGGSGEVELLRRDFKEGKGT